MGFPIKYLKGGNVNASDYSIKQKRIRKNGSEIGELITSRSQHKLYYDFALGLFYRNDNGAVETLLTKVEEYDSKLLEGKVTKAKKESHILFDDYNLVVKNNKGDSKIVKVDEEQYRNYQPYSNVKFRIDEKANNEVVIDLNKEKDIKSKKAFKKEFSSDVDS